VKLSNSFIHPCIVIFLVEYMSAVIKLNVIFMFVYYKGSDYCSLNYLFVQNKALSESLCFFTLIN
jgi:hypothetical protein